MMKPDTASGGRSAEIAATEDRVYAFIRAYIREKHVSPTLKEIGEATYMSRGNVVRYLDRLALHGRIERYPGIARGIVLAEDAADAP
jgi:DNA-binding MarR family transcriptional regulator